MNQSFRLSYIDELVRLKRSGAENTCIDDECVEFYREEYERLTQMLEDAAAKCTLPALPGGRTVLMIC